MSAIFAPRAIITFEKSSRTRVESLLPHGDKVLLGLSSGGLRVYGQRAEPTEELDPLVIKGSTDSTSIQSSDSFQLLSEHSQFSKRSVEQLGLIKEADILLSLSDGVVRLHDSREYSLIEQLTRSKGASQFALTTISKSDPESGIPSIVSRLAVAVKRRILFWTWRDTQFDVDPVEMSLESSVRSMTWIEGLNLVCGLNSGFVLVDSETQGAHDINYQRPQSDRPNEVETERFGAQGATMSYIGMSGWTPPTLATQLGQNEVLLARDVNSYFINTSGKPLGRRSIPWITAPDEIAYSYPYLLSAFFSRSTIEVRNPDTLSVLQTISLPSARFLQVPQSSLSLAHAAKGCYIVGDKHVWQLNAENYNSQVDSLSAARKWDEALSLLSMLEDALVTNKAQKLQAIQTEKATDMFRRKEYRKALELFTVAQTDPYTVIRLYPPEISGDAADSDQDPPEQKSLSEIDGFKEAIIELCSFLVDARTKLQKVQGVEPAHQDKTPLKTRDEIGEPNITAAQIHPDVLMDSLAESENSQQQPGPAAKLIDTTLFRAWMIARPSMATILFRQTNSCDPQTVTVKLTESHRYKELIDFYEGKGIHRPALELLRTFGDREEPDTRAPELFGPKRTVRYLRSLRGNGIDLILEFAVWPLKRDQTLGMEIFLSDSANAESLPRDQVIGFLSGIDSHLAMLYLEHVITDLNDVTQPHHDQYLKLLLTNAENDSHEDGKSIVERRQKLIHFLKNGHYTFRRALPLLDAGTSEALEGKAIVLGRMKQHKEVLRLYVFELRDYRKAEAYANTVELEGTSGMSSHVIGRGAEGTPGQSIHRMLLEMYLAPPAPAKPDIEHALELLSHHGPRLSYSDVMDVLPDDLHLIKLKAYFTGLMRASSSRAITASIGSNLSKVNLVEVEAKLLLGKGPHGEKLSVRNRGYKVAIDEDRICGVCQKRIGRSVISVLTNQRAVHYGCSR